VEAFIQSLVNIHNKTGLIHTYHKLFGSKQYKCEKLKIIDDDLRLGIKVKGKDIYIPKQEIKIYSHEGSVFSFSSENQIIAINVNKL